MGLQYGRGPPSSFKQISGKLPAIFSRIRESRLPRPTASELGSSKENLSDRHPDVNNSGPFRPTSKSLHIDLCSLHKLFIRPVLVFARPRRHLSAAASAPQAAEQSPSASPAPMTENPLLKESSLDFHYPPFDQIKDAHFAPAYEKGMAEQLKEIEPIAANPCSANLRKHDRRAGKNRRSARTGRPHFSNLSSCEHEPAHCKRSRPTWRRNFRHNRTRSI